MSKSTLPKIIFTKPTVQSDVSIYPSYTNLRIPYDYICRKRCQKTRWIYRKQFQKELRFIEKMQDKSLDGVKVFREFTHCVLNHPPVSNRKIDLIPYPYNDKERRRLIAMLNE